MKRRDFWSHAAAWRSTQSMAARRRIESWRGLLHRVTPFIALFGLRRRSDECRLPFHLAIG